MRKILKYEPAWILKVTTILVFSMLLLLSLRAPLSGQMIPGSMAGDSVLAARYYATAKNSFIQDSFFHHITLHYHQ